MDTVNTLYGIKNGPHYKAWVGPIGHTMFSEGNQADQSQPWVHDDPAHWQWTVSLTEYLVIQLTNNKSPAGNAILSHCKVCLVSLLTANVS